MKEKKMREVEVLTCDFYKEETQHLMKCNICGKGQEEHFAFSLEIFEYGTRERKHTYICRECAQASLFVGMADDDKSPIAFKGTIERFFKTLLTLSSLGVVSVE